MRMIGTIPEQNHAERFSDYLITIDVENMVEETSAGDWAVWIEHDDLLDRGKSELHAFLANPSDARYDAASRAEQIRADEKRKAERRRSQHIDVRTAWGQPRQWAVPVTLALILASVVVTLATQFGKKLLPVGDRILIESVLPPASLTSEQEAALLRGERQLLPQVRAGQVWRLVTPIFLHLSPLHLMFNLFWLLDLGAKVERQRGTWIMLGLVLAGAVFPNVAQYLWSGPLFGGMSGVVYALLGYVWITGRFRPHLHLSISQQSVTIMLAWLVLGMLDVLGPIANAAHLVGLIVGMTTAYAPYQYHRLRRKIR